MKKYKGIMEHRKLTIDQAEHVWSDLCIEVLHKKIFDLNKTQAVDFLLMMSYHRQFDKLPPLPDLKSKKKSLYGLIEDLIASGELPIHPRLQND